MVCKKCEAVISEVYGLYYCYNCGYISENNKINHVHYLNKINDLYKSTDIVNKNNVGRNVDDNELKHKMLCKELNSTYTAKNRDYGNSFTKTFDEFGYTTSAIRLQDKLERFKRLISNTTQEVKDESIRDTLMDLANYALMTVMELDKNER